MTMEASQIYISISIVALLIIAVLLFLIKKNKKKKKITPLAGAAFAFILAGFIFGDGDFIGYTLIGAGLLIAIFDILLKIKK